MRIIALLIILSGYMIAQDTLVTNAGVVYIGAFHGIDESSTTFQAEGSPAPSVLPNRLISKIILHGGTLVFADSSMMVENLAAAPPQKEQKAEITYEQSRDIDFAQNVSNLTKISSYRTKDGTLINIGDTLIVGKPATTDQQYTKYIGSQEVFSTITIGGMGLALVAGMNYLPATSQGRVLIVESISVSHTKLSKKSPLIVTLITRDPDIPDLASKNMITDLEHALLLGEIISPNEPMSREAAIKKLKESKELLDLEIISQQEYDKIKDELTPIIRN